MRDEIETFINRCDIRPFGVNPAPAESHAGYAARLGLPFPLLSEPDLAISRRLRRAPAGRLSDRPVGLLIDRDGTGAYSQAGATGPS